MKGLVLSMSIASIVCDIDIRPSRPSHKPHVHPLRKYLSIFQFPPNIQCGNLGIHPSRLSVCHVCEGYVYLHVPL
jgi:hypothetical protein